MDGFGLHNQLARFEVDREHRELVPCNGWRQKFCMDSPDFSYWVAASAVAAALAAVCDARGP
jgi:hypothetical protein